LNSSRFKDWIKIYESSGSGVDPGQDSGLNNPILSTLKFRDVQD
jgi:hypothetical protein